MKTELGSLTNFLVWLKATPIPGYDSSEWAWDAHGNVIRKSEYGNCNSPYGWEIDHYPVAKAFGGSDDMSNLRPLKCSANRSLGGLLGGAIQKEEPLGLLSALLSGSKHESPPTGLGLASLFK